MITQTKISNPTDKRQCYIWVPRHGITLCPGQFIIVNGLVDAKRPRLRKVMAEDIETGRVKVEILTDHQTEKVAVEVAVNPRTKTTEVQGKGSETVKADPSKVGVKREDKGVFETKKKVDGHSTLIEIAVDKAVKEVIGDKLNISGMQVADEFPDEPVYDLLGQKIEDDQSVDLFDIGEEEEPLAPIPVKDLSKADEEESAAPTIPSKSAVKKLNADKLHELADSLGVAYPATATKKEITGMIDALR